jgi:hypothetical protein
VRIVRADLVILQPGLKLPDVLEECEIPSIPGNFRVPPEADITRTVATSGR